AAAPAIQQRNQQNKTLELFKTQAPEFAGLVEAGMPLNEAWEAYTKQRFAQTTDPYKSVGGAIFDTRDQSWLTPPGGGRSEYGLTPKTGVDENGNPVLIQLGKDGTSIRT